MELEFFLPMIPPTVTHQQQKTGVNKRTGKPYRYEPPELKAARVKLRDHLAPHRPEQPMQGAVGLHVSWCFPLDAGGEHHDGEPKISKPDTDNLQKLLKDVMTELKFWNDDAQVAFEVIGKFWAALPGIYIKAYTMEETYGR